MAFFAQEGKACGDHRWGKLFARGHPQPLVVQISPMALFGNEEVVCYRVIYDAGDSSPMEIAK
jgi:hypothetical protein